MQVNRRKDVRTPRVLMHRIADIRGGVSVKASELGGDFLYEGAVLSAADEKGLCHVVKIAHVVAEVGASDKTIKVKKGHNFAKLKQFLQDHLQQKEPRKIFHHHYCKHNFDNYHFYCSYYMNYFYKDT